MNKLELQKKAVKIRKDIVDAVFSAKSGHPGGSLSSADIFTYLYFEEMNIDPKIQRTRTEIVSYFQRDIRHQVTMRHWQIVVTSLWKTLRL